MLSLAVLILSQADAGAAKGSVLDALFMLSSEKSPSLEHIAKRLQVEFKHDGPFSSAKPTAQFSSVTFITPSGSSTGEEPTYPGGTLDVVFTDANRPTRAEIAKRFGPSADLSYVRPCGRVVFVVKDDRVEFVRVHYLFTATR